jgi:hypothetical protein
MCRRRFKELLAEGSMSLEEDVIFPTALAQRAIPVVSHLGAERIVLFVDDFDKLKDVRELTRSRRCADRCPHLRASLSAGIPEGQIQKVGDRHP